MKKSVTVKGFRIHKDQKLIPYQMRNESKVLLPGTLPPCSRTLACSLGSEHTREGCTAHTIVPYNHNRCPLKALGARRHRTNCNSAVPSSALRETVHSGKTKTFNISPVSPLSLEILVCLWRLWLSYARL